MTEAEWNECDDPDTMLVVVRDHVSNRKLFQIVCGFLRVGNSTVENGPAVADMIESISSLRQNEAGASIFKAIAAVLPGNPAVPIAQALPLTENGPFTLTRMAAGVLRGTNIQHAEQADVIREMIGDPFRFTFDPAWRSETVVGIATGIEQERAWDRMPILADALQDAGCDDARVLDHCRQDRQHFRGCWVVDGCMGKE